MAYLGPPVSLPIMLYRSNTVLMCRVSNIHARGNVYDLTIEPTSLTMKTQSYDNLPPRISAKWHQSRVLVWGISYKWCPQW